MPSDSTLLKLHLGCGNNFKDGYVNIDKYVNRDDVHQFDILELPFTENSVSEILAEHLVEHLSFHEEKLFFYEVKRVLTDGGFIKIEVPDMEWVFSEFSKAKDDFKDFYEVGSVDHYFGNGNELDNRWGVLTTHIWGNQNGDGQFHKNGYTEQKLRNIGKLVGFTSCQVNRGFNKKTQVLLCTLTK